MKNNKWLLLLILLLVPLLLCGCWDKKEFNKISFATALAVDKQEAQYMLTAKIMVPKNLKEGGENAPIWIVSGQGRTLQEAVDELNFLSPRTVYWGHMNVVLLGESVLQEDMRELLNYFAMGNQFRRRNNFLVVDGQGGEILRVTPQLAAVNAFYINSLLEDQEHRIRHYSVDLNDIFLQMSYKGGAYFIPELALVSQSQGQDSAVPAVAQGEAGQSGGESGQNGSGASGDKLLLLTNGAIFKDGRLLSWVDEAWTRGYQWITCDIRNSSMNVDVGGDQQNILAFIIKKSGCRISLESASPLKLKLTISGEVNLAETGKIEGQEETLQGFGKIGETEALVNKQIQAQVTQTLRAAQKLNADVFGIGQWLNAYHPQVMAGLDQENYFADMDIQVEAKVKFKLSTIAF